jgi:hypothetical protein
MSDDDVDYGPVFVTAGKHKGRILYFDDTDAPRTGICYVGHPLDFVGSYDVQLRYLREPTIDDLLTRREAIWKTLTSIAIDSRWPEVEPEQIYYLFAERALIDSELYGRRLLGELSTVRSDAIIFLCHSSSDKGMVRMVNDDLKRLGANVWLDENQIHVGDSVVDKVSEALGTARFLVAFLSKNSVRSLWAKREWQSALARQLVENTVTILPVLLEDCDIPTVFSDIKYADFRESYHDGLKQLHAAIRSPS